LRTGPAPRGVRSSRPLVTNRYNPPDDCGRLQDMSRKNPLVRDQWDVATRE